MKRLVWLKDQADCQRKGNQSAIASQSARHDPFRLRERPENGCGWHLGLPRETGLELCLGATPMA
jgi:hypothetical protein